MAAGVGATVEVIGEIGRHRADDQRGEMQQPVAVQRQDDKRVGQGEGHGNSVGNQRARRSQSGWKMHIRVTSR